MLRSLSLACTSGTTIEKRILGNTEMSGEFTGISGICDSEEDARHVMMTHGATERFGVLLGHDDGNR